MNPTIPPDAFWMNTSDSYIPLYDPHLMLLFFAPAFALFALPSLLYVARWLWSMTAEHRKSPGRIHTALVIPTSLVAAAFGYLTIFAAAAWWTAGGYDCSPETPVVQARLGTVGDDSNLCFNSAARVKAVENNAAAGSNFGHLIGGGAQ
jgi:hypothetical protein